MTTEFGPAELRRALVTALFALRAHQDAIDDANVYPVPDGDTGTNMALTLAAAVDATNVADEHLAQSLARAALVGARGNSGVILAQILSGLLAGPLPVDAKELKARLSRATELAYGAVLEPVEGTILTVMRAASEGATGSGVAAVLEAAAAAARIALDRTPEELKILKDAGVLDAGGMGLWVVLDAFAASVTGREPAPAPERSSKPRSIDRESGSSAYAYEVQYLLEAPDDRARALRQRLGAIGDSVVVSGGGGLWNVHVHTNDTDGAIAAGNEAGTTADVSVATFAERGSPAPGLRQVPVSREGAQTSVVAVVAGDGLKRMYGRLGAGVIVDGGPTMNPSVGELLEAVTMAPTEHVLLLPNNADAIPAAIQAATLAGKQVAVIETRDLAQGFTTMLAYGDARDFDANVEQMRRAASVATGARVVVAARDAMISAGRVRAGQAMGFIGDEPVLFEDAPATAVLSLAKTLDAESPIEALTLFTGASTPKAEADAVAASLRDALPGVEVECHEGGQPVERYLIAVE